MQSDVAELVVHSDWMLGAEKIDGLVSRNRLFLITELTSENLPGFVSAVEQLNRTAVLGQGYSLLAFDEPCMGCEVTVKPGWELGSSSMQEEFLMRFIKALQLELLNDSNTNR